MTKNSPFKEHDDMIAKIKNEDDLKDYLITNNPFFPPRIVILIEFVKYYGYNKSKVIYYIINLVFESKNKLETDIYVIAEKK